jgi:hypothetical protein
VIDTSGKTFLPQGVRVDTSSPVMQNAQQLAVERSVGFLVRANALHLAAASMGGEKQAIEACRKAVWGNGMRLRDLPSDPSPKAVRAAARRLADGITELGQAAALLRDTECLRSAMASLLMEDSKEASLRGAAEGGAAEAAAEEEAAARGPEKAKRKGRKKARRAAKSKG